MSDKIRCIFVGATIGRPLTFSSDFGGRAMHAPTKSKLILLDIFNALQRKATASFHSSLLSFLLN